MALAMRIERGEKNMYTYEGRISSRAYPEPFGALTARSTNDVGDLLECVRR